MSSSEYVVVPKAILEAVRDRFNEYADHHAAKPDPEKAKRNRDMADMVHEALAAASPSNSRLGGEPVAWAELRADIDAKLLSDSFDRAVVMYGPLSNATKISELAERDALLRRLLASPTSGENGVREASEARLLAAVLRSRGRSNSLFDINRAADLLDVLSASPAGEP